MTGREHASPQDLAPVATQVCNVCQARPGEQHVASQHKVQKGRDQRCQMCLNEARPASDYCSEACFLRGEGFVPLSDDSPGGAPVAGQDY